MIKYCRTCDIPLDMVLADPKNVWTTEYLMCSSCNGTYNIDEVNRCKCKYAHQDGACKWPTLEGRLNNPLTTELEALKQLQKTMPLSMTALKRMEKLIEKDERLKKVREQVQKAVDSVPKTVTFEEAEKQVKRIWVILADYLD